MQVLLLPPEVMRIFVDQYISHPLEKESKFNDLLNHQRKIRSAAMQEPNFKDYLLNTKNNDAEVDKQNFIEKIKAYKINKGNLLSDNLSAPTASSDLAVTAPSGHALMSNLVNTQMNTLKTEMRFHIASDNGAHTISPEARADILAKYKGPPQAHFEAAMDAPALLNLENDAEIAALNARDENGKNAAHIAAERGNAAITALADAKTVDMNAVDNDGNTPLLLAAKAAECDNVVHLHDAQETLEVANHQGRNPLHYAVLNKDAKTTDFLLKKAPKLLEMQDKNGQTPLHYVAQLEKKYNPFSQIRRHDYTDKGVLNIQDNEGKTPLHYSIIDKNQTFTEFLIRAGADVNLADKKGKTALHHAAETNNTKGPCCINSPSFS